MWSTIGNNPTMSEGNLKVVSSSTWRGARSSFVVPKTGKFYCEVYVGGTTDASNTNVSGLTPGNQDNYTDTGVYAWFSNDGTVRYSNADLTTTTGPDTGDIMSWYVNDGEVKIYLNNSLVYTYGTNLSAIDDDYFFYTQCSGSSHFATVNFGQDSSFAGVLQAQNNDDDGDATADWYYAPPTDVESLCSDNLSDPEIALPGENFNTILWTGTDGGGRAFTGVGFQPDFVWAKNRDDSWGSTLVDSVRGGNEVLSSDHWGAEVTNNNNGWIDSFDSDGFTVIAGASNAAWWNLSGDDFVAWNWKAGTTFDPATAGTVVTGSGSSNATAGFSIVGYEGTGAAMTIGHGLSSAPELILVKNRDADDAWSVYCASNTAAPETEYLVLNTDATTVDSVDRWNDALPSSSVFTVGDGVGVNTDDEDYIAYCFHSVDGYSKVGSYVGNANADGPFTYTGFKPEYLMVKKTDSIWGASWIIRDNARTPYNLIKTILKADSVDAEVVDTRYSIDFLSNGFKTRDADSDCNGSGLTYIFLAFAESPFKTSNAR